MDTKCIPTTCDLILKGGITSGVIYPRLVSGLATKFNFKNIGGVSAGAIAAAGAAAAQFRRLKNKSDDGFKLLADLPDLLKAPPNNSEQKENMLFLLFQPAKELNKHFAVAVGALNATNMSERLARVMQLFLREFIPVYWLVALIGALPGLLLSIIVVSSYFPNNSAQGWKHAAIAFFSWLVVTCIGFRLFRSFPKVGVVIMTTIVVGFVIVLGGLCDFFGAMSWKSVFVSLASGVAFGVTILGALTLMLKSVTTSLVIWLPKNNFGFCSGLPTEQNQYQPEALTQWLSHYFDEVAGKPTGPLTFGDLWGSEPSDIAGRDECREIASKRVLNLEVMTTAVSQGIPYRLPFSNELFCFDPMEWSRLFPAIIIEWMMKHSRGPAFARSADGHVLYRLPHPADFPVAVAVRMSLSFPILLSAIPLYSVDRTLDANAKIDEANQPFRRDIEQTRNIMFSSQVNSAAWQDALTKLNSIDTGGACTPRKATRVWFSDGGISSNLPLHFFDSKLPSHPTFAINLTSFHPDDSCLKNRVELPDSNTGGLTSHWPERPKAPGVGPILSFLLDIVNTMHSWRDTIQLPMPGYRDRIAQIAQKPDEGGLNLNMPREHIDALASAGALAAHQIIEKFVSKGGWDNHRAIRLRTMLGLTEGFVLDLQSQYPGTENPDYSAVLGNLPSYEFKTSPDAHVQMAEKLMSDIHAAAANVKKAPGGISLTDETYPHPIPDLRIVPRV